MPDFKRTSARDNPHPDKVEAQRERDRAQIRKEQADASAAAGTDNNRDAVDRETKFGRGASGLNTGPSDTVSADPHRPIDAKPLFGSANDPLTSDGMGASPPRGPQPTSDKPAPQVPIQDRARQGAGSAGIGNDGESEAQRAARKDRDDRNRAAAQGQQASGDLRKADGKIAGAQSGAKSIDEIETERRIRDGQPGGAGGQPMRPVG